MLPSASNMTMPSAVVSRMAGRPSAGASPGPGAGAVGKVSGTMVSAATVSATTVSAMTGATGAACGSAQISACALSPSQSIACRCASVVGSGASPLASVALIVTGVPACDVLLAADTPGST